MNGQAGECFWMVRYRREGEPHWEDDTAIGGKFPIQSEADAFVPSVLAALAISDPGFNHETAVQRLCCGMPLPGE